MTLGIASKRQCDVGVSIHPVGAETEMARRGVDAGLESLLGVMYAALPPFVAKRTPDVVDVPRRPACAGRREVRMQDHNGAAVDEQAYLGAEFGEGPALKVVEEVAERRPR